MAAPRKIGLSLEVTPESDKQIRQLGKKIAKSALEGVEEGTHQVKRAIQTGINTTFKQQTGVLYRSVRVENPEDNVYEIRMAHYGKLLDEAPDHVHWISLKPGRKITKWAKGMGIEGKSLKVMSPKNAYRYQGWIGDSVQKAPHYIQTSIEQRLGELK